MRGQRGWTAAQSRAIALAVAASAAILVFGIAAWQTPPVGPASSGGPFASASAPRGPVVYYEVLDATGSKLVERRLDGVSLPRVVAQRADAGYGRTWTVDPTATTAISAIVARDDQALEAISVATGVARWSIRTPTAPLDQAVWAADGSRVALTTIGSDVAPSEVLIIDATTGALVRAAIPDDTLVQGFATDGSLILRRHRPAASDENAGWDFLRLDPVTTVIAATATPPEVGPASDTSEDVHPAAGVGVDTIPSATDDGTTVRLWRLAGGAAPTPLVTMTAVDRVSIDPAGTGVAISSAGAIRFVTFDGRSSVVYAGDDPIADFVWSPGGDELVVATDRHGPNLTLVERSSGRSVDVPQTDPVAQLFVVRVIGGSPLPASPLPAAEPTPSPTAAPSGADVDVGILAARVDASGPNRIVHVERLVPTESGGLRVAAAMPPLDLGPAPVPDDGGPEIQLLPRPSTGETLVWLETPDRAAGWLWDGESTVQPLRLPADWPDHAFDLAWRPDGAALAASAGRSSPDGEFEAIFVVAEPGVAHATVVPIVGEYDRLEGWWSTWELRVGHGICTEGCAGTYAWSARLRIADRKLTPMTPADRAHAPIDEVSVGETAIVLSVINAETADDISIAWPASLGSLENVEPIGFAGDGRSLLVAVATGGGTDVLRIPDPVARAVHGRVDDPDAVRIAHLDGRDLTIDISADQAWALVTDRVDQTRLVRLSDGRAWPVDRDLLLAWAAPR